MPGENIKPKDSKLYININSSSEPYLPDDLKFEDFGPVEVPECEYFKMGITEIIVGQMYLGFVKKDLILGSLRSYIGHLID